MKSTHIMSAYNAHVIIIMLSCTLKTILFTENQLVIYGYTSLFTIRGRPLPRGGGGPWGHP